MGDIKVKIKKIILLNVVLMVIAAWLPQMVWAAGVEITAVPGLGGLYKMGRPVEINITVVNDGPAIKGNIRVQAREMDNRPVAYLPVYRMDVEIPANTNLRTTMLIPGELASRDPYLELWVDNASLSVTKLQGTVNKGGAVTLTLGEKILQGGFVSWAEKAYGSNLTVKYLPPQDLPQTFWALASADIIVVDQESVAFLKQDQVKVIKEWVNLGGCLILSEGAGIEPGGIFEEFNPIFNDKKNNDLLRQEIGRGVVLYSRSALGDVSVDNKEFWESFNRQLIGPHGNVIEDRIRYIEDSMHGGGLTQASSYLPQLKFPSIPKLAVFWGIYLLVVGPLAYIVLKRFDRRDWSWVVIPICSLIAAAGVFLTSPSQKLSAPFGQTLAVVEIMNEHLAEVRGAGSFITVKGGSVKVTSPPDAMVVPVINYSASSGKPVVVNLMTGYQEIAFNDVEYWSMRQSALYTLQDDFGQLVGNLRLEDDRVVGTVKNNTDLDLRDCRIQVAQRLIDIGKLSAGQEKQISERLEKWPLMNRWGGMHNQYRPSGLQEQEGTMIREEQMLSGLASSWQKGTTQIEFTGWSDRDTSLFKINKVKDLKQQTDLTLVRQFFRLELPTSGVIKLPPGIIPAQVIDGGFIEERDGFMVAKGEVTFEYNLSELFDERKVDLETVYISGLPEVAQQYNLKIFNWKNEVWDELNPEQKAWSGEALVSYLSDGKILRIKLLHGAKDPGKPILPPTLSIRGELQ